MRYATTLPLALSLACGGLTSASGAGAGDLVGEVSAEQILAVPGWAEEHDAADIDLDAAQALREVPPGATVDVFLGTWCSDSRREVPRLLRALSHQGTVPFRVRYVGVDRALDEPAALLAGERIRFVPTFIVRRDGAEVGRVVESAPRGIEVELHALLSGEARGIISRRADL
ncbi:MAG: thioredoxin family protein [Myxococcota bacterium]